MNQQHANMDTFVTLLPLVLLVVFLLYVLWTKTRRNETWPPGPPTIPFIGNLNVDMRNRISTFRKLRKQYGNVFSLILGAQTVVVVSGLEAIKEILVTYGDMTNYRPNGFGSREITHHRGNANYGVRSVFS